MARVPPQPRWRITESLMKHHFFLPQASRHRAINYKGSLVTLAPINSLTTPRVTFHALSYRRELQGGENLMKSLAWRKNLPRNVTLGSVRRPDPGCVSLSSEAWPPQRGHFISRSVHVRANLQLGLIWKRECRAKASNK